MKEYYHKEPDGDECIFEKIFFYKGKGLLVVKRKGYFLDENRVKTKRIVMVEGFVDKYKQQRNALGVETSFVKPIPSELEGTITELLNSNGLKEEIYFA
ncbi:hypothetical protein JW949_00610 [Candidatus Woesearchaeota archaeon]|nr:hypothetical protein [Candidatus Woesearchaeota archaeon]